LKLKNMTLNARLQTSDAELVAGFSAAKSMRLWRQIVRVFLKTHLDLFDGIAFFGAACAPVGAEILFSPTHIANRAGARRDPLKIIALLRSSGLKVRAASQLYNALGLPFGRENIQRAQDVWMPWAA
jgi:hypothetical protein